MVNSTKFIWRSVTVLCDQYWVLYCYMYFINDLFDGAECTHRKYSGDEVLEGMIGKPGDCAAIQRHLDNLENWASRRLIKLKKGGCEGLHLGRNNPSDIYWGLTH